MKNVLRFLLSMTILLTACQKDIVSKSDNDQNPSVVKDDFLAGKYEVLPRRVSPKVNDVQSSNFRSRPVNDCGSCRKVILLVFDGDTTSAGSVWSYNGSLITAPAGLTLDQVAYIDSSFNASNAFGQFKVLITLDRAVYNSFKPDNRQRVVFTQSWEWFGKVGGVSRSNSMELGNDDPAYVFTSLLGFNQRMIAQAGIHEIGHTLGLIHQSDWDNGVMVHAYSLGLTPNRCPFMGLPYYDIDGGEWISEPQTLGTESILSQWGSFQNDYSILKKKLGIK